AGNANTSTGNYLLPTMVIATADISQRQLTASATAENKVYDGNTNAAVTGVTFGNVVTGEALTAGYDTLGSFADKNAGNGKVVTISGVTMAAGNANTSIGNYLLPTMVAATADISQRQLTAIATAQDKAYDGNTTATVTNVAFGNLVAGESLTISYTGSAFSDKNVGGNKAVTLSGVTMTANNANTLTSNYLLPTTVNTSAAITPISLTITALSTSKTYEDVASAANPIFNVSYTGFVNGETPASLGGALTFSISAIAGQDKYLIIPSGYTSSNYNITYINGLLTVTRPLLEFSERYQGALTLKSQYRASAPLIRGIFDGASGRGYLTYDSNPLLMIRGAGINLEGTLSTDSNNADQDNR
ncbi:MAG: YDG domain-containing protein, partial [Pelosinus sp.]|nr:YDG domain-containing protein [Pelosinus sp.]